MRVFTPRRIRFFVWCLVLSAPSALFGQTADNSSIVLDGHLQRHVISAQSASQLLTFESLIPGETYSLIVPDDPALSGCMPEITAEDAETKVLGYDAATHQLKFTVSAAVMSFRLSYPCAFDPANPPRHYISIICETCKKKDLMEYFKALAVLEVSPGGSAEELVREVLVGGDCFDITNVTFAGNPGQIGTFSNGQTNIGFNNGMIMATGDCSVAVGPNGQDNASAGYGNSTPDGDLSQLSGSGSLFDLANIEFDFTPTQTPLTFEYVFGSEEYCEYVGSQFNDAFGFFISGPGISGPFGGAANIASLGPGSYVAINNVNHITNSGLYVNNQPATSGNLCGQQPSTGQAVNEVQFDGFTKKLTAVAPVIPCQTYHIKLKICDVGDGIFDSGVFLKAGSFDGGGNAAAEWLVNGLPDVNEVYEGCGTVQLVFDRVGSNFNAPLAVQYTITGTATAGVDYQPIPLAVVIPAGQDKVTINVPIFIDNLTEGPETIILKLTSPCSCIEPTITLTINDLLPLTAIPDTTVICGPGVGTVSVTPDGGVPPYSYHWNTGGTDQSISQFVSVSTNFQVTVTDDCGKTIVKTARILVKAPPKANLLPPAPQLCPGQTALIQVTFTGIGPFELNLNLNGNPLPPIQGITETPYFVEIDQPGLYQIASVVDADGCVGTGLGALLVTESTLNMTGTVTNTSCVTGNNGAINTTVTGGQGPFNYTWNGPQNLPNFPDPTGLQPGTYNVTVTDFFGCTNAQQFIVSSPPAIVPTIAAVQGANCSNPTGGSIDLSVTGGTPGYTYKWNTNPNFTGQDPTALAPGNYTVTITDASGCTSTTTAAVPGDFTPPEASATVNEQLTCIVTSVELDGTASSIGPNFIYNWTASNGGIIFSGGNTLNPVVIATGTYTLVVTNNINGCTASQSVDVTADNAPPTANAGPAQSLTCVVDTLTLDGSGSSSGPNFIYYWTASNGGYIISGDSSVTPVVNQTGTYNLLVTNTSNGCTSTSSVVVGLNTTPPTAVVAPGGQITCTSPNIQLSGAGSSAGLNYSYEWIATNGGNISLNGNTLNPTATATGTYTLIVTNNINGCTASAFTTVTSNASLPTAVATPSGIITCAVPTITLSANGSSSGPNYSYQWTTTNGQVTGGQGTATASVNLAGQYVLIVTNTTNNCTSTFTVDVQDDLVLPTASAGAPQTLLCSQPSITLDGSGSSTGSNFTYQWTSPNGGNFITPSNIQNPQVDQPGIYQILVTNIQNGCTSTAQVQILEDANDPVVQIATPGILNCNAAQITLNGNGSSTGNDISYAWTGPGIVSGDSTLTPVVNAPGNYTLVISNSSNGCTSEQVVAVSQDIVNPPADAGPDLVLNCYNPQQQLGGSGNPSGPGYTFVWTGPGITSGGNSNSPTANQGGNYTLLVTNTANGCTSQDAVTLTTDFAQPAANAGATFQLNCVQETYTLQATGSQGAGFTYQWTTTTGNFTTASTILTPTVDAPGTYNLLVTNTINGCTATSSVQISQAADLPVAVINTPQTLTCAVNSVTLNGGGSSTGPEFTYQWTASPGGNISGNGNTLNPTVNEPGTYTLVITNTTNSCTMDASIQVNEDVTPPAIDAGQQQTLTCTVLSVNLTGTVSSPGSFTYQWTTTNGNIGNGANTLTPTVNATGDYTLLVTNQQNGCTSTDAVTVSANQVDPVAAIQQPAVLTCTTTQFPLNATGSSTGPNMDYQWTTTGGNFLDMSNDLQPVINEPGSYILLVTNLTNGCTQTASVAVTQDIQNPTANAGADGLLTCAITSLQLDGTGSSQSGGSFTYQWTTTGGQILNGANTLTPTIGLGGTYSLTVLNQINGCTATDNALINVNTQPPTVAIATPGQITCVQNQVTLNGSGSQGGAGITYTWTTQGGSIVSGQNSNQAVVNTSGNYTLTVFNSANGCSNSASVAVTDNIVPPTAEAGAPFTLTCSVEQVTLQGSGSSGTGYGYAWSTQGGNIVSGGNSPNPVVNQQGTYTLTVTNLNNGCTNTDAVNVLLETNVPTDFAFTLTEPSCKDNDGVISFGQVSGGFGPYLYSINNGQTFVSKLDFTKITPGTYDLWIQDANGCEFHKTLIVPKAPDPVVTLPAEFSISLGDSLQLEALLPPGYPLNQIDTVIWTPLEGLTFEGTSITDLLNPTAKPFKPTEYKVTIISGDGCEASDRVLIRVDNEPHIYIPNVFSPWKEDGENDIVYIFADGNQVRQIRSFQIFDRWGEQVFFQQNFQPNDPKYGWNGRLRGKLQTPAVFVYYAEIDLIDGRTVLYKGDITLLR